MNKAYGKYKDPKKTYSDEYDSSNYAERDSYDETKDVYGGRKYGKRYMRKNYGKDDDEYESSKYGEEEEDADNYESYGVKKYNGKYKTIKKAYAKDTYGEGEGYKSETVDAENYGETRYKPKAKYNGEKSYKTKYPKAIEYGKKATGYEKL
jgi:peptidyl-prolyl cis-trans isomerase-like 4